MDTEKFHLRPQATRNEVEKQMVYDAPYALSSEHTEEKGAGMDQWTLLMECMCATGKKIY